MLKKQNVLITGATGYLGSNILSRMLQSDRYLITALIRTNSNLKRIEQELHKIKVLNIDQDSIDTSFSIQQYDILVHCATQYDDSLKNKSDLILSNVVFPLKLIELMTKNNGKIFLNIDTMLNRHVSPYSRSKKNFLEWFKLFSKDIKCINLQIEHFYGPNGDKNRFFNYFIHAMIDKVPEINLTSGEQERDFIYIDDAVDAILLILEKNMFSNKNFQNYEIGSGHLSKVKDVYKMVQKYCCNYDTKLNFGAKKYRKGEQMKIFPNINKLKKLGWKPKYNLALGLRKTINETLK